MPKAARLDGNARPNVTPITKNKATKASKQPPARPWRNVYFDSKELKQMCKKIGPAAVNELDGLTVPQLKNYLALLANYEVETKQRLKEDETIKAAKDEVKLLVGPYTDQIKDSEARRKYCVKLISDRVD
jgi:hypothetical protein